MRYVPDLSSCCILHELVETLGAFRGAGPDTWSVSMQWAAITGQSSETATSDAFQRNWSLKEVRRCIMSPWTACAGLTPLLTPRSSIRLYDCGLTK